MPMPLGPIRFEVHPFNATDYDHGQESGFVEKPMLRARSPIEWVGEGSESWSIRAPLFPHRFGGLGVLNTPCQARAAGRPVYLMCGDGAQMGWVVIEKVSERSSFLDRRGIGRVVEIDISVRRAGKPSDGIFFSVFSVVFS